MSRLSCFQSRMRASYGVLFVLLFALMLAPISPAFAVPLAPHAPDRAPSSTSDLNSLPLAFIPNAGQSDAKVRFVTSAKGATIFFAPNEVVFALVSPAFVAANHESGRVPRDSDHLKRLAATNKEPPTVLRMAFLGANAHATLVGTAVQPGVANYLLGDDPHTWLTNLPTYAGVGYHSLYAGIDLHYAGSGGQFKSTYLVAPGADPTQLRWNYAGANNVTIDKAGNLVIALAPPLGRAREDRTLTEQAPIAWQDIAGQRVPVAAAYALHADGSIGFTLGQYDPTYALTIDPILTYSSYLGGSGSDSADAVAVGSDGSIYVTGNTQSTNFPTTAPYQGTFGGSQDAFVTKIQNGVRVYSTYWGGNDYDTSAGIAVDSSNQIYITGNTVSTNLTWPNAYDNSLSGFNDAYLVKFNAAGSAVLYATLLGGSSTEIGYDVAVSGSKASLVGITASTNFVPTSLPSGTKYYDTTANGSDDTFVAQFDTSVSGSTSLKYISYLGGSDTDYGYSIAINSANLLYIAGFTYSTNLFPGTLPSGTKYYDTTANGGADAFIAGFDPAVAGTSSLKYATYFGGSDADLGQAIALDTSGNLYLTGNTYSNNLPSLQPVSIINAGGGDIFVSTINPSVSGTSALVYSTYFGGTGADTSRGIAVHGIGYATIIGTTTSSSLPKATTGTPMQTAPAGGSDVFIAQFFPPSSAPVGVGNILAYSAYLGGSAGDAGADIAVDSSGKTFLTGATSSLNFPTTNLLLGSAQDAFVATVFPEYEQQCHWPHVLGANQTLLYDWGAGLTTPGTAWRNAFTTAIQSWNSAGTRFTLTEATVSTHITMMLYSQVGGPAGSTDPTCSNGSGSTLLHANVKVNTAIVLTPVTGVPAHEIGHGQGLGHIASDTTLMRYDTGGFGGPQPLDLALHHLIYP